MSSLTIGNPLRTCKYCSSPDFGRCRQILPTARSSGSTAGFCASSFSPQLYFHSLYHRIRGQNGQEPASSSRPSGCCRRRHPCLFCGRFSILLPGSRVSLRRSPSSRVCWFYASNQSVSPFHRWACFRGSSGRSCHSGRPAGICLV